MPCITHHCYTASVFIQDFNWGVDVLILAGDTGYAMGNMLGKFGAFETGDVHAPYVTCTLQHKHIALPARKYGVPAVPLHAYGGKEKAGGDFITYPWAERKDQGRITD